MYNHLDRLEIFASKLRAAKSFSAALDRYLDGIVRWRESLSSLNKVVATYTRSQIIGNLLYLDFMRDSKNPDSGATFVSLTKLSKCQSHFSSRVLLTVLSILQVSGMVQRTRSLSDRRQYLYVPTKKLIDFAKDWHTETLGCFDLIFDKHQYAKLIQEDEAFIRKFIVSIGAAYHDHNILIIEQFPDLYELMRMEGGLPIAAALVRATLLGVPRPAAPTISRQFNISISQVRRVFACAEQRRLIVLAPGGTVSDCKNLCTVLTDFISIELAFYGHYGLNLDADLI
jgi:DNA-binding MarR family transcriptional regulator